MFFSFYFSSGPRVPHGWVTTPQFGGFNVCLVPDRFSFSLEGSRRVGHDPMSGSPGHAYCLGSLLVGHDPTGGSFGVSNCRSWLMFFLFVCLFIFWVKSTVPGAPSNVSFPDVSFTSARVIWDVPLEPNGEIVAYRVTHYVDSTLATNVSREFAPSDRTYRVTGLEPEQFYMFQVSITFLLRFT